MQSPITRGNILDWHMISLSRLLKTLMGNNENITFPFYFNSVVGWNSGMNWWESETSALTKPHFKSAATEKIWKGNIENNIGNHLAPLRSWGAWCVSLRNLTMQSPTTPRGKIKFKEIELYYFSLNCQLGKSPSVKSLLLWLKTVKNHMSLGWISVVVFFFLFIPIVWKMQSFGRGQSRVLQWTRLFSHRQDEWTKIIPWKNTKTQHREKHQRSEKKTPFHYFNSALSQMGV